MKKPIEGRVAARFAAEAELCRTQEAAKWIELGPPETRLPAAEAAAAADAVPINSFQCTFRENCRCTS